MEENTKDVESKDSSSISVHSEILIEAKIEDVWKVLRVKKKKQKKKKRTNFFFLLK